MKKIITKKTLARAAGITGSLLSFLLIPVATTLYYSMDPEREICK